MPLADLVRGAGGKSPPWYSGVSTPLGYADEVEELDEGDELQVNVDRASGLRGTIVVRVVERYVVGPEGLTVLVSTVRGSSDDLMHLVEETNGVWTLHLCTGPQRKCGFHIEGRDILHVDQLRVQD